MGPIAGWGAPLAADDEYLVYIGTYTRGQSKGIYVSRFRPATGALSEPEVAAETDNPSFVAADPSGRFLYATNESGENGSVSAFAIDRATGKLGLLNRVSSGGNGPCHLVVDQTGRNLLVANFASGSIALFRLREDGSLGERTAFVQHSGSSVNPNWQKGPHAHSVGFSPGNRFALVTDLGLDKVLVYRFDAAAGSLDPKPASLAQVPPGSGPRHFAFHPDGKFVYVLNQLTGTLVGFAWDESCGALDPIQNIGSMPKEFTGINNSSEVTVAQNGKFLYSSNRGPDTIAVFSVDRAKGTLALLQQEPTRGISPRHFAIDPSGAYLFVANQYTDQLIVFAIEAQTGRIALLVRGGLQQTSKILRIAAPVCVTFVRAN